MKAWLASVDWTRVGRTFVQVFGGVLIAFLLDFGADGKVEVLHYVYGDSGVIIAATTALALWMNRPRV